MTVKAIITRVISADPNPINNNLVLTWEVMLVGPEIEVWSQGAYKIYRIECTVETDGTDTVNQMAGKLTDCAVNDTLNSIGEVIARGDVFLPDYQKGV